MFITYNGQRPKVHPSAFVAPTAALIGNVTVEEGASIWFGAVLRADDGPIVVGARSSVQDNVVIHVHGARGTLIGTDVTVGHGAILEGCTIERGALVGMNAVVLQEAVVGEQALVAAGSTVAVGAQIPQRTLVAGAPAKVKKSLEGASLWWIEEAAALYVKLNCSYRAQGIGLPDEHEVRGSDLNRSATNQ